MTMRPQATANSQMAIGVMMTPSSRVFYLDACRAAFMLLGIVIHAAEPFVPNMDAVVSGGDEEIAIGYVYHFINAFRMPGFFIIAGYFAALMIERHGSQRWMMTRLERLAVPLVVAIVAIVPLTTIAAALPEYFTGTAPNGLAFLTDAIRQHLQPGFHWVAHLWFVFDLLVHCSVFAAVYAIFGSSVAPDFRCLLSRIALPPALLGFFSVSALAAFLVLIHVLANSQLGAAFAFIGDYPFWYIFDVPRLLFYAPFFLLGVLLCDGEGMMEKFARPSAAAWAAGILSTSAFVYLRVHVPHRELLATALVAPTAVLLTRMWMHVALNMLNRPSRFIHNAVDASYTIYIVHLPIAIAVVAVTAYLEMNAFAGFFVATAVTCLLSIGVHLATKNSSICRYLLNGKRHREKLATAHT
jgi:glucans biosynthesis protein C